ncbi:MAG: hypothetical protein M1816_007335 [Peltula sp. TS41687]|nr:MAG: hypothetical protein M1816_007335 [Peltula sp. TS41687]
MYHSGIGGGGFMLVRSPKGAFEFIDFREKAPVAAFQDMFNKNVTLSILGGLASGVPGELRGLEYLHKHYGCLPWKRVVAPAVNLARNGFVIDEDFVNYATGATAVSGDFLSQNPTWAIDFAPNGTRVKLGDVMTRKRYANTLETIGEHGVDAFYTGEIAEATIRALQKANGSMTMEDLRNYSVAIREPLQVKYRNYTVTSCSAPSSGVVVLSTLNTISGYDMGKTANINLTTHRLDEAIRFGYGQRTRLGDPLFVSELDSYQRRMVSPETGAEVRSKISDPHTLDVSAYDPNGIESLETPGTSHVSVSDNSGMTISLTTTVNLLFGSQLMVPETGVIMNNQMNDFSIPNASNAFGFIPSPNNFIRPGKRPMSSISPTIVTVPDKKDGGSSFYLATGSAGGSRIITTVIQTLWHVLDQGMSAPEAIAHPRLHDQLIPNVVSFEPGYDLPTIASMRERGHNITFGLAGSTGNAIRLLPNGTFEAAGEPRQKNSGGLAV